jgi:hypothetical protein
MKKSVAIVVAHVCNSSYWGNDQENQFQGCSG